MRKVLKSLVFSFILIFSFSSQVRPGIVYAGSSAIDLINAVNEYRATYGLAPYDVDSELMGVAQGHSDYQASINDCTHVRADGSRPQDHGVSSENIAMGSGGDVTSIVTSVWQDYWHFHTMVGYTSGRVGAGAAESNGYMYYTLDVKNTGDYTRLADEVFGGQPSVSASGVTTTPAGIKPIVTATAGGDGAVIHIVEYGQSLWGIAEAYGVNIPTLAAINALDTTNPLIWVGQKIIVQASLPATQTPTITQTPIPATSTLRPTRTQNPVSENTSTPLPTITPTPRPALIDFSNPNPVGIIIIVVCVIGLIGVISSSIWSKMK